MLNVFDQDPRTPVPQPYGSSPEVDYFRAPIERRQQVSRWKEDWEELELLVRVICLSTSWLQSLKLRQGRGAFGSVVKARNKIDSRIYAGTVIYYSYWLMTTQ